MDLNVGNYTKHPKPLSRGNLTEQVSACTACVVPCIQLTSPSAVLATHQLTVREINQQTKKIVMQPINCNCHRVQTACGAHSATSRMGTGAEGDRRVNMISRVHLVPRRIMRGASLTFHHTTSPSQQEFNLYQSTNRPTKWVAEQVIILN
jgi:hypothetical protein